MIAAAAAGVLCFLGFVGFGFYPMVFVAWVPVLYAIRTLAPGRAYLLGLVFGTVATLGGYYWIVHVLTEFGDLNVAVAVLALLLHCVYQGSMMALVVYLVRRADVQLGLKPIWALPAAYPAVELLYPQLFPFNFGAALYAAPVLTQIVEITGVLGLTALVGVANGAVWELVDARITHRRPSRARLLFAGVVTLGVIVYGVVRLTQVDAQIGAAPRLKVALVQTNMGAREKLARRDDFIARHREMSAEALRQHPDLELIVWPESAYNRPLPRGAASVARAATGGLPVPLVFGAITYDDAPGRRRFYNSAMLVSPTGDVTARFDKMRLLAFGEGAPWILKQAGLEDTFLRWFPRASAFARGDTVELFRVGSTELLPTICYEGIFGDFVRDLGRRAGRAGALLNLTNDSWFGDTHEPRIHLALTSLRSIEHRRALIRSTNTGISALVDPAGRIYRRTGQWTRESLAGEVPILTASGSTPYQTFGDLFGRGCVGLVVVGWIAAARARRVRVPITETAARH
jgi:apolipoprotein N-acyltransferase